ncbi:MAG: 4Fe-4S dicluster domain-containing protein [Anaerolineaceae bacterium]|nr:4Fe-4S dicluster domain-containing protein [Anaerolineaceae bacterium]
MTRYVMVMDTRRCIGCHSCTVACKINNDLPVDMIYNPVVTVGPEGVFPHLHINHYPLTCMHCDNPPCVGVCPTGASQQNEDGIVFVNMEKCIGCKACIQACPYNARHSNHETGTVVKCDFCMERVHEGEQPYCVKTCHQNARIFGDLDNPDSKVSILLNEVQSNRFLTELGTDPQVYYIVSPGGQG